MKCKECGKQFYASLEHREDSEDLKIYHPDVWLIPKQQLSESETFKLQSQILHYRDQLLLFLNSLLDNTIVTENTVKIILEKTLEIFPKP